MRVSVVIPHLKGVTTLLPLLDDLKRERDDVEALEVILIDNDSQDGSSRAAHEAHPWIRWIRLSKNLGYAGGCNAGIRLSGGDWILLLNDDVTIRPGAIRSLLEEAESDPGIAAVQPKILSMQNPTLFDYAGGAGGLMDRFGFPFALGRIVDKREVDTGQYDQARDIFWASGTACLWKRETLQEVGLLDSGFFAHMEEIDLAWRAWNAGWRIRSAPSAVVEHLGGGTLAYQSWLKMYLNHRNNLIMIAKNESVITLLWLLPVRWMMDWGVGVYEFASGRPGRIAAILAAWAAFIASSRRWWKRRKGAKVFNSNAFAVKAGGRYHGSILWAYARGKQTAGSLA